MKITLDIPDGTSQLSISGVIHKGKKLLIVSATAEIHAIYDGAEIALREVERDDA